MRLLSNASSLLGLRGVTIQAAYWIATAIRASLLTAVLFGPPFVDLL
jgi:hypothetical protein